ncbi:MAG: hypothetical protein DMG00_13260, partial [Acidobacteria bacterium]
MSRVTSSDRFAHVEQLYHAALARDERERAAFLRDACGADESLRRELESLLAYADGSAGFLEAPAIDGIAAAIFQSDTPALAGQRLGSYEIGPLIGAGGMGDVYRARDTKLGRDVAIKILPEAFTADPDRRARFEREARAASALNHPNIVTIHEIGETDRHRFIVMELVEGRTLRAIIPEPFDLDSFVQVTSQIVKALAIAHAAGIIHRDIKPENVMVRGDGYVKLLDFGLARLVSAAGAPASDETMARTASGLAVGTARYMSPEQARGDATTAATDIFSLGIVFYERDLPESVRSMIQKKIAQLSEADVRLLTAASVQGFEFDSGVVAKAVAIDAAAIEERLDVLERVHSFIRFVNEQELPDRTLTLRFRFVHVLYQNALYASLRPTRRASLSAAVAEALIGFYGAQRSAIASELAVLFEAARDFEHAAEHFLAAAQQAASVSANKEAAALARRGLNALAFLPETRERREQELRLQTSLGPALMGTVGFAAPEVEAAYNRARELCRQIGETPQLFPVMWGLWQYWLARGNYQTALDLAKQLLATAEPIQDDALLLMAEHAFGNTLWLIGDFESARASAERHNALYVPERHHSLASRYGGYDTGVAGLCGLTMNLWPLGYPEQAAQTGRDAIALAREIEHQYSLAFALTFNAMVHQYRGDVERTRQDAEHAITLAAEHDLGPWLAWATVLHGWALAMRGQ